MSVANHFHSNISGFKKTCINPSDRWLDAAVSGCLFLLPVELNTQENKGVMLPLGKCPFLKNA